MDSVIRTGLNGLVAASSRLQLAANKVVNSGAQATKFSLDASEATLSASKAYSQTNKNSKAGSGTASNLENHSALLNQYRTDAGNDQGFASVAEGMVQAKVAARTYEANAKVIQIASEMYETEDENDPFFGL